MAEVPGPRVVQRPPPGFVAPRRPVRTAADTKRDALLYLAVGVIAFLILGLGVVTVQPPV